MSALVFHMIGGAPDPVAPFSHAVEADGWAMLTGQTPFTGCSLTMADVASVWVISWTSMKTMPA